MYEQNLAEGKVRDLPPTREGFSSMPRKRFTKDHDLRIDGVKLIKILPSADYTWVFRRVHEGYSIEDAMEACKNRKRRNK